MIFSVRHETRYEYTQKVDVAAHLLHLTPLHMPWQRVLQTRLISDPPPSRIVTEADCFDNATTWLFHDTPHDKFAVTLEATVHVTLRTAPAAAATPPWETVATQAISAPAYRAAEFLYASPMVAPFSAVRAYVEPDFPPNQPVFAAIHALTLRIYREFAFRTDATEVGTPLAKVLAQRAGVCQDFSHLMIAGLRSMGLPARYASGYIRTRPPKGGTKRVGADQSHAWVSAWLGPAHGWIDFDPTNALVVSDEHVVLAYGRDFSDVSPVSGVILGGGAQTVHSGVDLAEIQQKEGLLF
jgi:transglutaminase-like putative cysteine protease